MKEKLLTATLLLLTTFALIAYADSPETFDVQYNPPKGLVLEFDPEISLKADIQISKDYLPDGTHLPSLAKAIAWHETHDCTKGYGVTHNNCFGIKDFYTGKMRHYRNKEHAYKHFYQIWKGGLYGQFPDEFLAKRWTGADRYKSWLVTVNQVYNREINS